MNVLLVGADKKLPDEVKNRLSRRLKASHISQVTALNHAIESTQVTAYDVIINALPVSVDDGVQLSEALRSTCSNYFTPVILYSGKTEFDRALDPQLFHPNQPIYVAKDIGEITYLIESFTEPAEQMNIAA